MQLAAALVHGPELLVLDEPFSGLDPIGVDVLSGVLRAEVERGVPVLFSSHQLELVERLCDAVAIVKDGRIVAAGDVEQLRRRRRRRTLRVTVEGADGDWLDGVAGAEPVAGGANGDGVLVALDDGADPQAVLDRARRRAGDALQLRAADAQRAVPRGRRVMSSRWLVARRELIELAVRD